MSVVARLRAFNEAERSLPLVLLIDLFLFLVLIASYLVVRARTPVWPRPFHFPTGLMTVAMIMFAIAASFVLHVALRSAAQADWLMTQRMLALALVGWSTFLFLLALEWGRLYLIENVKLFSNPWNSNSFGLIYYGLSGLQAAHVLLGCGWLLVAAQKPQAWNMRSLALFVDFTNSLFILLAFVLILSSADLNGF